jgi:hypothetical protein
MTMGRSKPSDMQVAMGSAVYGTPHMMSNCVPFTQFHIMRDTCKIGAGQRESETPAQVARRQGYPCRHFKRGGKKEQQQQDGFVAAARPTILSMTRLLQDVWVGHNDTQVDIDGRQQAALQLELPKLDRLSTATQ